MAKASDGSWAWRTAGIGAVLLCLAVPTQAAQKDVSYKPPAKGLVIVFADLPDGKTQPGQASMTQKITAVTGDEASFTEWVKTGGLVIAQKHKRFRSLFSFRVERHNGTLLHDFDKAALRRLWPLAAGKKAALSSTLYFGPEKTLAAANAKLRRGRRLAYSYVVEGTQTAKLPAGAFKTFVILRTWRSLNTDGSVAESGTDRIWLATELGWIVRLERRVTAGPRKGTVRQLVAVSIKRAK